LFDKRYVTSINNISTSTLGTPNASINAPRFWGVELGAHF
jgi:iron complex outermembrane receptor protein